MLVADKSKLNIKEVENIPITVYNECLDAAINISNYQRGGELKLTSREDEYKDLMNDAEDFKDIL